MQTLFRRDAARGALGGVLRGADFGLVDEAVDEEDDGDGDEAAHAEADEGEAGCLDGEGVVRLEDIGEGGEEGVHEGEVEGGVEGEGGDDGLGEEHVQRAREAGADEGHGCLRPGAAVADGGGAFEAELLCAVGQDLALVGFFHEDGGHQEGDGEEEDSPGSPAPPLSNRYIASDQWTKGRA
ncbi:hypothetical protein FH972_025102 [Carpinus fangiana]|uniref:Uncharacterized protein n=1 Tax=Carpinus fangiana TaxID=176857 RepID=A0A5N6L2K6_9ROSI|nr:hypothetical protein FH972_025102 [Carpinus fangiana]